MDHLPTDKASLPPATVAISPASVADSDVPELRQWHIGWAIGVAVVAAVLAVAGLIIAALWYAGYPSFSRDGAVTAGTLFELFKLAFAMVAGVGGVVALVVAYRRQRVAEHTNKLAELAHKLAQTADVRAEVSKALSQAADERAKIETDRNGVRLFNERFAEASEQLGSEKPAVRLAGVYAMAGLADDWQDGRQTCIDVLCAYLRMPYTPPEDEGWQPSNGVDSGDYVLPREFSQDVLSARQERQVRHTVIRLIGAHLRLEVENPASWSGHDFDFTGAVLDGGDLSAARFTGGRVSFDRAEFSGGVEVSFAEASFSGANVSFVGAKFCGAEVLFTRAAFAGGQVWFQDAEFTKGLVVFDSAAFTGSRVFFGRSTFAGSHVIFIGAGFAGGWISFWAAKFRGGSLRFESAVFDGADVRFDAVAFEGADVSFAGADLQVPPAFDPWPADDPPTGLVMPHP